VRLCVPLSAVNRLTAIVLLSDERAPRHDAGQLLLLSSLAKQAALAYDQALLFGMQQERLQTLYRAEQLIVAGQLAANIAHEVKNPLATIRATLQYLASTTAVDHAALVQASIAEVDRIDRTVRGLLNLSRPAQISRVPVNVAEVLRDALLLVQVYAQRYHVRISNELRDDVLPMMGDARELKQLFVNLLMNACQSLPQGGDVRVAAELSSAANGAPCINVRVIDSGNGMTDEDAAKAFDPFFTTKEGGTGLGLPVCLQIVSRHGGTIELDRAAKGITARVTLPLAVEGTH
jgi:signal transduction histidine kinase